MTLPTLAVIQARASSTRLPGKVLLPLGGRSVLSWVIRAARESGVCDHVVVATSTDPSDDDVAVAAWRDGVGVLRGSLDDVLSRFVVAVEVFGGDPIVRLTADCPLLDPEVIRRTVIEHGQGSSDYTSTTLERTLPRGLDVEVVAAEALRRLDEVALGVDRTHVTSHLYRNPGEFRLRSVEYAAGATAFRVTLDEAADYQAIATIVGVIGDRPPAWAELVALLESRPDIAAINAAVRQKGLEEG